MATSSERASRVQRVLDAVGGLRDGASPRGKRLRARLLETSRLSPQGVELALTHALERQLSEAELERLLNVVPEAQRAHVLLSGNVFVAALRAIVIGAACAPRVSVRASRRDPALAEALYEATQHAFALVPELKPAAGDRVWAYGSDSTLATVRASLPRGVWLHAHGHGLGAVVVEAEALGDLKNSARAIALDTVLFDQRGCLSPRLVCALGSESFARALAEALATELDNFDRQVPIGRSSEEELAELRRYRDAATYAFELLPAGSGFISLAATPQLVVPPAGRNLHVARVSDPAAALMVWSRHLTCIGVGASPRIRQRLSSQFSGARVVALGTMQCPPLDGPVDLRTGATGELVD